MVPRKFKESVDLAYSPIFELLKRYDNEVIIKGIEKTISILARSLKEALIVAEDSGSVAPLTKWKNDNFEKDDKGGYRLNDTVANKKLLSIAKIMTQYETYLRENGLFDFDDMIEEAIKVLRSDAGFKMTLQEKYQFIMLDEFQDTNPSQFAIVKELTDYEKPMIMAVGDDDQAIYEFQGALSSNLTDFQRHYESEVIPLVENYRSTQEILDFSHRIIEQAPDRFADKELLAHKEMPEESQIYRYEFNSSDSEFGFVANEIARLIQQGVKQSEIAIISYKSKYFEPLLPFLKAHREIKIAYEKRDNLLEDERINALLTLARYIYEKANMRKSTVQIMEILSYDFFELPPLEILKLVNGARLEHKDVFEYVLENGSDKIRVVMDFLATLIVKSLTEPLELMIDYLIGTVKVGDFRSPFMKYYTENIPHESAYADSDEGGSFERNQKEYAMFMLYENIASLRGKLVKHFGDKALKLSDLVAMVDDYVAADMPLNTTSPYRDGLDAVQVLTAHKAKGLEFEYVFIISADHTAWGKGKGNNNLLSLPKNLLQIRHTGVTDGEKLRVLYVALTRAKKTLYITNSLQDFNGKSPERLEYFDEYTAKGDDGREEVISPFLPRRKVMQIGDNESIGVKTDNVKNWLTSYLVESPDMREFYKARMAGFRISASALTSFLDIIYNGPQEFFKRYILGAPSEPDGEALVIGNLMHSTFERVAKEHLSDEMALDCFRKEVEKYDTTEDNKRVALEKGEESLELTLKRFGGEIRSGLSEVSFYGDSIAVDTVPMTGKIDLIVKNDTDKTIEIYDYKTGSYRDGKWESYPNTYWYMMQLWFYKMLLNNSVAYRDYKVTRGHILFVMKDVKTGEVYDKVLDFDEIDSVKMQEVLKAVYKQATELDFLDEEDLFVRADKNRSMKQVREFIELLLAKSK